MLASTKVNVTMISWCTPHILAFAKNKSSFMHRCIHHARFDFHLQNAMKRNPAHTFIEHIRKCRAFEAWNSWQSVSQLVAWAPTTATKSQLNERTSQMRSVWTWVSCSPRESRRVRNRDSTSLLLMFESIIIYNSFLQRLSFKNKVIFSSSPLKTVFTSGPQLNYIQTLPSNLIFHLSSFKRVYWPLP